MFRNRESDDGVETTSDEPDLSIVDLIAMFYGTGIPAVLAIQCAIHLIVVTGYGPRMHMGHIFSDRDRSFELSFFIAESVAQLREIERLRLLMQRLVFGTCVGSVIVMVLTLVMVRVAIMSIP